MWVNVVIHSLDGRCLRQHDEHAALSRLAACRAVRMIASVDHPDTSLMHGFVAAQQFQACWHHVPTLLPLWNETWEIEPCLQARQSSEVHLDAVPVLQTLTQNSQHVWIHAAGSPAMKSCHDKQVHRMTGHQPCVLYALTTAGFLYIGDSPARGDSYRRRRSSWCFV